jgi:DNA-3-methyladenine glycosylase
VQLGRVLTRGFFARPCLEVAPDLLGVHLVRKLADGTRMIARIVEVEAYLGDGSDPGSHSHRGETARNRSMFGPPGRLYAYRIYGMHTCLNVVCEAAGSGAAILFRAVEPLEGIETMRRHRGPSDGLSNRQAVREIARGPGRLAQALAIGMAEDGTSILRGAITLRRAPDARPPSATLRSARIGLTQGADLPYRFYEADNPWVCPAPRADRHITV